MLSIVAGNERPGTRIKYMFIYVTNTPIIKFVDCLIKLTSISPGKSVRREGNLNCCEEYLLFFINKNYHNTPSNCGRQAIIFSCEELLVCK